MYSEVPSARTFHVITPASLTPFSLCCHVMPSVETVACAGMENAAASRTVAASFGIA
jgi:hypothetical protein